MPPILSTIMPLLDPHTQRAALEGRSRAADVQHAAIERRHVAEVGRLATRISHLEAELGAERSLAAQLQEQLQGELQHVRALTESDSQARAAESSVREMLDMSKKVCVWGAAVRITLCSHIP